MAFIYEFNLPRDELSAICSFMQPGYSGEIPDLSELGTKVLDRLTNQGGQPSTWSVVVGRFVQYTRLSERNFWTPDGFYVKHADRLMSPEGRSTGKWGVVEVDLLAPTDAYEIGVLF